MPSDSQFAISMKNQQDAEREEQKRIKNHILNLDLQDLNADHSGTSANFSLDPFLSPNPNLSKRSTHLVSLESKVLAHDDISEGPGAATEKHQHNASLTNRQPSSNAKTAVDKSSSNRRGDRARKLQLSDVDWYDATQKPCSWWRRGRRGHGIHNGSINSFHGLCRSAG